MKSILYLGLALTLVASTSYAEQQRILRRVIKSTPTATNLGRIRLVTVRSTESGGVTEISGKEAASFGQRGGNDTTSSALGTKSKQVPSSTITTSTTTSTSNPISSSSTTSTTTSTTAPPSPNAGSLGEVEKKHKASDRQQAGTEVELLSGAPSSWQTMTAVEAPAAMLIATGARAAQNDLSSSASSYEESSDFLRASTGVKGGNIARQSVGETFSRIRQDQQQRHQVSREQTYFRPSIGKTSPAHGVKTQWYQTTSSTPRPAPLVQQQEQHYEQQNEQYVEQQQQQIEYGAAPLGQAEPFAFDFKTEDQSGNGQYRKEESDKNGVVRGSYGYTDANGIYRHVEYVADQDGFRANIKSNEPGLIGETQPASIQLAGAAGPRQQPAGPAPAQYVAQNDNWNQQPSADLALAPPDFESSHKSGSLRAPRHFRN